MSSLGIFAELVCDAFLLFLAIVVTPFASFTSQGLTQYIYLLFFVSATIIGTGLMIHANLRDAKEYSLRRRQHES